jgi:6-phosphogluconolactonase (cycloisomerase 2 family)
MMRGSRWGAGLWLVAGFVMALFGAGCGHTIDVGGGGSPAPVPNGPEFAYVSNSGDGVISAFKIDPKTGALSFVQQVATGATSGIKGMAATPGLLYVASESTGEIFGFRINAKKGTLAATAQGSMSTGAGTGPVALAISPVGSFLYAVDAIGNQIFQYSVNKSDGALKAIPGAPLPTGNKPVTLAIAPAGQSLFVGNQTDGTISGFSIAKNGALAASGFIPSLGTRPGEPQWLSSDPAGGVGLYDADAGGGAGGSVSEFKITGATLSFVGIFGTGNSTGAPLSVAVNRVIQFIYTANDGNDNASKYQILSSGLSAATLITGLPSANSVALDQTGAFFFITDQADAQINFGTINQTTGDITPVNFVNTEQPANSSSSPFQILTVMTPS